MHIAINGRSILSSQQTGIGRYTYNLIQGLLNISPEHRLTLYTRKDIFAFKKKLPVFEGQYKVRYDYYGRGIDRCLPTADVFHSPFPAVLDPMRAKVIVTIHDLVYKAFEQGHTETTLHLTDKQIKSFLPFVKKVICCSENTRRDLHRFFDLDEKKSCVIYQGVDHDKFYEFSREEKVAASNRLKTLGVVDPFFLFVGTIEARKNLKGLLAAFAQLKGKGDFTGKLVVAGMKGWKSEDIEIILKDYQITDDVIFTGFVDDHILRDLYNLCEVFVFPSFYEGFGYPILEAFCCGAASVVSKTSACPEVCQDAGLLIDPNQPKEIAFSIKKILQEPELKGFLKQKALARAKQFSFEKTARETLDIYQHV